MSVVGNSTPITAVQILNKMPNIILPGETPQNGKVEAAVNAALTPKTPAPQLPKENSPAPKPEVTWNTGDLPFNFESNGHSEEVEEPATGPESQSESVETPEVEASEEGLEDEPTTPAAENFKKLRTSLASERKAKKELEAKLQEAAAEIEKFHKGELAPEVIQAKDRKISELEKYRKIVDYKLSDEYQAQIVEPIKQKRQVLAKYANDYGLPEELVLGAAQIDNERELNSYLSRYFDPVGAIEVKKVVQELHDIGDKALQMEKEPEDAFKELQVQYAKKKEIENTQKSRTFEVVGNQAWEKALEKTRDEGAYKELILHPTDQTFNKTVVEPIQAKAATQFGALIKQLASSGLKRLDPELATGLARMSLLAIAGAMTLDAKNKAEAKANQLIQQTKQTAMYVRPSLGGNNGTGGAVSPASSRPLLNPQSAADKALEVFKK